MTEITLQFDKPATKLMNDLMIQLKVKDHAALVSKALSVLKIAADIKSTDGELIARKNGNESRVRIN